MWMARSAPLARASRMVCAARSGPAQSTIDFAAVLLFQLQRLFERISVRLVDRVARDRLLQSTCRALSMRTCASRSGTCLMATMIFIAVSYSVVARYGRHWAGRHRARSAQCPASCGGASLVAASASRNMVLQNGQAVPTTSAPGSHQFLRATWLTRSPVSSPRNASPPPAPQQKLRSRDTWRIDHFSGPRQHLARLVVDVRDSGPDSRDRDTRSSRRRPACGSRS